MALKIIGTARDLRTSTIVAYAQLTISDYLTLIGDDFESFEIQRRREKYKGYERLKRDITGGTLLPPITLAVKIEFVENLIPLIDVDDLSSLEEALAIPGRAWILDGLQRTHILRDIVIEGQFFPEQQTLLVEFWFEQNLRNLIYRIIVLNAGQKPMSLRHQVEILFFTIKNQIEERVPELQILTERENTRRTRPKTYPLDRVVTAYQSFLGRSPEVQRENIVATQLIEEDVLSASEEELGGQFELFVHYLKSYTELDEYICRIYDGPIANAPEMDEQVQAGLAWFGSENVMNSFFAALADFGSNEARRARIESALGILTDELRQALPGSDPLGRRVLQELSHGFNTRRVNVGFATRKLLVAAFKEFFREEGQISLEQCWRNEAA